MNRKTTPFEVEEKPGKSLCWVRRVINGNYYCRIVWKYPNGGVFSQIRYNTFQDAVKAAQYDIIYEDGSLHLETINQRIEYSIKKMDDRLNFRLAEFRGLLFAQKVKLKAV